jgi:hypothetical protein
MGSTLATVRSALGTLLGIAILLGFFVGLIAVVFVPAEMRKMSRAETWPARKGVITTSYARRVPGGYRTGPSWRPEICGRYRDTAQRFCIARVRYGGIRWGGGKAAAEEVVARHPVGAEVDVFVSPADPRETVLDPHPSWTPMVVLLSLGVGFLLLPVVLWMFRRPVASPGQPTRRWADERPDGTLVLTHDSSLLAKGLLVVTAVLLATAAYDRQVGNDSERLLGLLGGAATTLLAGLLLLERSRVRIDPRTRRITWDRRWGLSRRSRVMPFATVTSVEVERPLGDEGVPSRRIVFRLADGSEVPATAGYHADPDGEVVRTAERIRGLLGQNAPSATDAVRALVDAGRVVDAVKLLRESEGVSLTEAKRRLDEIRSGIDRS